MSVKRSGGSSDEMIMPLSAEGHDVRIRGDLDTDMVVIDSSTDPGTQQNEFSHPAEDLFDFLDSFDSDLMAVITRTYLHVEYGANGDWFNVRLGLGKRATNDGEPARNTGESKEFPEIAAPGLYDYYGNTGDFTGDGGGMTVEWATPQDPSWYIDTVDEDDDVTVYHNHDSPDATARFSTRIGIEYQIAERV